METLDWSQCPPVESIPGKVSGAWVFKGTRLPVATVIENLEDLSIEEVIEQFDVSRQQITAVLEFVAESLRASGPVQTPTTPAEALQSSGAETRPSEERLMQAIERLKTFGKQHGLTSAGLSIRELRNARL